MFNLVTSVRSPLQALAMLLAVALVLWTVGVSTTAQAANLTSVSNTLTDSEPSAQAGHTFEFTVPAGSDINGEINITFPSGFTDVASISAATTTFSATGTAGAVSSSGQVLTIAGVDAAAGETVTVEVAEGIVTNPATPESYEFEITTQTTENGDDIGLTRVVILDNVLVTASVETIFEFTVSGVASSTAINAATTTGTTSATEIPFGVLSPGAAKVLAQDLTVSTNARNGFVVTVEQDQDLLSSTGAIISPFEEGSYVDTPTVWSVPSGDVNDDETWGHWGLTSNDTTLNGLVGGGDFTANDGYVAASTTPRLVFAHDGSANGAEQDIGTARVGYKIEITALQEAGEDYTTTLTYIATPTF